MRVAMTCPYSLSRPGGVQGQVLGLARELRKLGIDVRVVAPCDGPPPAPGVVCVSPSVEWSSNGSVAPISPGRATARRTAEVLRSIEPDLAHIHEPAVPGPCLTTLIGFNGPIVATFHAFGELAHMWTRPALRAQVARLSVRVVVSQSALETALANWSEADYVGCGTASRSNATAPPPTETPCGARWGWSPTDATSSPWPGSTLLRTTRCSCGTRPADASVNERCACWRSGSVARARVSSPFVSAAGL